MSENDFSRALSKAIKERDLTLERLADRLSARDLAVTPATLSYWQTGRSLPRRPASLAALDELETVLGVEQGYLRNLVEEVRVSAPGYRDFGQSSLDPLASMADLLEYAEQRLGTSFRDPFDLVSRRDVIEIDENGMLASVTMRDVVASMAVPVSHWMAAHTDTAQKSSPHLSLPHIEAIQGCIVAEEVQDDAHHTTACRLELPEPLQEGQEHIVEYEIQFDRPRPLSMHFKRFLERPTREYAAEVHFHPDCLPDRVDYSHDLDAPNRTYLPVEMSGNVASFSIPEPLPGATHVRWFWPQDVLDRAVIPPPPPGDL